MTREPKPRAKSPSHEKPRKNSQGDELENDRVYRPNVAIVLCNREQQVFWARRINRDGWQFPQGGVEPNETTDDAVFRELYEEIGLSRDKVRLVGRTREWLHYDLPRKYLRSRGPFRGQKQIWYLFELTGTDSDVTLEASDRPEFDDWRWVNYWDPVERIVNFKQAVYKNALTELEPLLKELMLRR